MKAPPLTDDKVLVQFAEDVGSSGPVAVEGMRTRWNVGGTLRDDTRLVVAPRGVVEFQPHEMIVVVRAGTLVADLADALAEKGQRCALPDRGGTVGGALAVGENDLAALGKGTLRSSVLEVRYVSAEGKLVRAGGPTVKNVTGFDLPRLIVGSLGTIGCIAEVILRTNPVPSVAQWYVAKNTDAFEARDVLLRPSAVLWDGSSTWVLLEGHSKDVQNQAATLSRVGRFEETDSGPDLPKHRWSLAPSDLRTMSHFDTGNFVASIGVGTVYGDKPQPPRELSAAVLSVTQRIKENFDPIGRLNPGRMVGGL